jgi:sugar/nucleoside kinase (ribokinase family)
MPERCLRLAQVVPPYWATDAPVDTCGAGDAYAAGVLWAYLRGMGVAAMGRAGARVASQVGAAYVQFS